MKSTGTAAKASAATAVKTTRSAAKSSAVKSPRAAAMKTTATAAKSPGLRGHSAHANHQQSSQCEQDSVCHV
jgi:hypothetical protein